MQKATKTSAILIDNQMISQYQSLANLLTVTTSTRMKTAFAFTNTELTLNLKLGFMRHRSKQLLIDGFI